MITIDQYFGRWNSDADATVERRRNAEAMLKKVNPALAAAEADGVKLQINRNTKSQISGNTYGGFRPQSCPQGAPHSSHKEGRGVDVYDPDGELDEWLDDEKLEGFGLYREAPESTPGWCHLTDRAPPSGHRTFKP